MIADVRMNHSVVGSYIQAHASRTLVQENDGWVDKSVKYTLGTAAHAIQAVMALIELVVAAALLIFAKTPQFLMPKDQSTWFDANILDPLATWTFEANIALLIAASRIVTNFLGYDTVRSTNRAIKAKLTSVYSSDFVQAIKGLHINGLDPQVDNLLCFFERLPIPPENKPTLKGTPIEKATMVREWMAEHADVLETITTLNLESANLHRLPPEIGMLTHLTELYCDNNLLTSLPPEIGNLRNLIRLNLDDNQLTSLPPEIWNLSNLQHLCLDDNLLTFVSQEIGKLCNLTTLYLNHNPLSSLPPELWTLTHLESLHLENTQLTSLPPEIGNLHNLITLNLDYNQLTVLPPEIGMLTRLTHLYCNNNRLTSLPSEIGMLTRLTHLYCNNNRLTSLPSEIENLRQLKKLDLHGNRINTPLSPRAQNAAAARFPSTDTE